MVPDELDVVPAQLNLVPTELNVVSAELNLVPAELSLVPAELNLVPAELNLVPAELELELQLIELIAFLLGALSTTLCPTTTRKGYESSRACSSRAGQAWPGQARPGQARPGQARPGQARQSEPRGPGRATARASKQYAGARRAEPGCEQASRLWRADSAASRRTGRLSTGPRSWRACPCRRRASAPSGAAASAAGPTRPRGVTRPRCAKRRRRGGQRPAATPHAGRRSDKEFCRGACCSLSPQLAPQLRGGWCCRC
jgi:hypothetical protein